MNTTIIYYTSNRESSIFEQKVRDNILAHSNDLPIVSVSQKPIAFGTNIVVGEVGVSGFNMFRQVQIACREAKTRFVLSCEADCLYPPDYFNFEPDRDDVCYRNSNLYVLAHKRAIYWHKPEGATHAQIIGREYYLNRLSELFKDAPDWSAEEKNFPRERGYGVDVFDTVKLYETKNPVVQIKTSDSMRYHTHSERVNIYELPYWGDSKTFRQKYL